MIQVPWEEADYSIGLYHQGWTFCRPVPEMRGPETGIPTALKLGCALNDFVAIL